MFYLFLAVYSMGVDVAGVVFYSELFPNHIRAKGVCLSMATVALTDLVYLQATTTAFANIKWRFYLVFIINTALGSVIMWFVLPETKGIPLEEMARIFGEEEDVVVWSGEEAFERQGTTVTDETEKMRVEHREQSGNA